MLSHCYSVISFMIELTFDVQVDRKNNFRDVLPISQSQLGTENRYLCRKLTALKVTVVAYESNRIHCFAVDAAQWKDRSEVDRVKLRHMRVTRHGIIMCAVLYDTATQLTAALSRTTVVVRTARIHTPSVTEASRDQKRRTAIYRVKWRHTQSLCSRYDRRVVGITRYILRWDKWRRFIVLFK